jgi:hypothetical protein
MVQTEELTLCPDWLPTFTSFIRWPVDTGAQLRNELSLPVVVFKEPFQLIPGLRNVASL